jgi:poly(beta-D-mannuronate) lyase
MADSPFPANFLLFEFMAQRRLLLLTILFAMPVCAAEFRAADVASFDAAMKKAGAGDIIVLQSGEWKDVDLRVRGQGEKGKPITVRAAEAGKVKLTGNSRLRFGGEHLVVESLWFQNCFPESADIVTFREDSKKLASHCVLRGCAITQDVASIDGTERKWVSLYGQENVVEHCHFEGKTSKGTLLVVWLPERAVGSPPKHRIERNYFGPRPRLGKNGGEIIRIGDSESSMQRAECLVEGNYFEKCDGEVECISNKSCGNVYRANMFMECQGTVTMRHGNGCLIEGNVFNGNHRKQTGGIRIIGEDHVVRGNYLSGIEGDEARSAICLQNGIERSPAYGYFQVKRAIVAGNSILDCKHSITIGYADKDVKALLPPIDCQFAGNYVSSEGNRLVDLTDANARITWKNNVMWGNETGIGAVPGISFNEMRMKRGLPQTPKREEVGVEWLRMPAAK